MEFVFLKFHFQFCRALLHIVYNFLINKITVLIEGLCNCSVSSVSHSPLWNGGMTEWRNEGMGIRYSLSLLDFHGLVELCLQLTTFQLSIL